MPVSASTPRRADADRGGSGAAVERGGGVGSGGVRQPPARHPPPPVHPPKSIHRRTGMNPPFLIHTSGFVLECPALRLSILLPKAFTGELAC